MITSSADILGRAYREVKTQVEYSIWPFHGPFSRGGAQSLRLAYLPEHPISTRFPIRWAKCPALQKHPGTGLPGCRRAGGDQDQLFTLTVEHVSPADYVVDKTGGPMHMRRRRSPQWRRVPTMTNGVHYRTAMYCMGFHTRSSNKDRK